MKKYIFLFIMACTLLGASADNYSYLNFVNTDASVTQLDASGLKIVCVEGNAVVTVGDEVTTLPLSSLDYMEFTNIKDYGGGFALGDVDGSGVIDVGDVNVTINIILKLKATDDYPGNADMDDNGVIDVSDVNAIINIILKIT